MKLSVIIPAHNEEGSVQSTVAGLTAELDPEGIDFELIVVDDASTDRTAAIVARMAEADPRVRCVQSPYRNGFGFAVRAGLEQFTGDAVAIVMADGSDNPKDLVAYYRLLLAGYDCAFGSRFVRGGRRDGYPLLKMVINRVVNTAIRLVFGHGYNDTTNAFKAYRREVIENIQPLISQHFNLTVEMPLKAIVRGHSYATVPITWTNRSAGDSKLRLTEMGSRYLFIVLYVFFEHHLSRGDYRGMADGGRRGRHAWRAGTPGLLASQRPEAQPASDRSSSDPVHERAG
jgi:dolichol-phosphate mannosyltransferase